MKIKLSLIVAISFLFINNAFAHKEWVHQYLVWESYEFMKQELGYGFQDLGNHIGNGYFGPGDDSHPWATGLVGVGAWREDLEDPVYGVGVPFNGWTPSSTHFWDADCGDNCQTPVPVSGTLPNAWQKVQRYLFGGSEMFFYNESVLQGTTIQLLGRYYKYNSLVEFYNTGICEYHGYLDVGLNRGSEYNGPVTIVMDVESRKKFVYMILGRIAHLLADMGVPAHTHKDIHNCAFPHYDEDSYEIWMGGNATGDCNEPHTNFPAKSWSKLTAKSQGSLVNLWGMTDYTAMKYLFYTQNQLADHFSSNDELGDNNLPQGSNQYLLDRYQILGNPPSNVELSATASECFNYSIRATAALFEWFGRKTNQTKVYLPMISSISFNNTPNHEIFLGQTGVVTCNSVNATSYSWQWYACSPDNSCHVPVPGMVLTSQNNKYLIRNNSFNNNMTCSAYESLCNTTGPGGGGFNNSFVPTPMSYYIKVTATNSYGSDTKWYTYNNAVQKISPKGQFPPGGGGCPFVLVHNGEEYIYDNNILHRSQFPENTGLDIKDKYLLNTIPSIDSTDSTISIGLTETTNDHSYLDKITLVAVDHPQNSFLGITENNDLVLYYPQGVSSSEFAENSGVEVTQELEFDSAYSKIVNGDENDSTTAEFPVTDLFSLKLNLYNMLVSAFNSIGSFFSSNESEVFLDGEGITDSMAVILDPATPTDAIPNTVKMDAGTLIAYGSDDDFVSDVIPFALRQNGSVVIVPVTQNINIDKVSVNWDSPYEISYISTTPIFYGGYIEHELTMESASHSDAGDIKSNLQYKDQTYSELDSSSNIILKFRQSTDSIPFGWVRSYVFISDGKYTNPQNDNYISKPILDNLINDLPIEFVLNQNYPNPFNPSTNIQFDLPKDVYVTIKVYDIIGREVTVLLNDFRLAGRYIAAFNGSNLASGIYYYTIKAGSFEQTKRMVLIK